MSCQLVGCAATGRPRAPALREKVIYGSRDGQSDPKTSREAFHFLHAQYPNRPEAQRTRYCFREPQTR